MMQALVYMPRWRILGSGSKINSRPALRYREDRLRALGEAKIVWKQGGYWKLAVQARKTEEDKAEEMEGNDH